MTAIITECPFLSTEQLADTAAEAMESLTPRIERLLEMIADGLTKGHATGIDDVYMAAITAVQNATIRKNICTYCSSNNQCHPAK